MSHAHSAAAAAASSALRVGGMPPPWLSQASGQAHAHGVLRTCMASSNAESVQKLHIRLRAIDLRIRAPAWKWQGRMQRMAQGKCPPS